jgi:thiamine kinase-like enzyme
MAYFLISCLVTAWGRVNFLKCNFLKYPTVIFIFCSFCLGGCQNTEKIERKIEQCLALTQVVNSAKSLPIAQNLQEFSVLGDRLDQLDSQVQALKLEDRNLNQFKTQFSELYKSMSVAARQINQTDADRNANTSAQAALKAATTKEAPLVDAVNRYCSQKS